MMDKFTFSYPTKVYFGEGKATEALRQELPNVGKTVIFAYGGGSVKQSGIYEELKSALTDGKKEIVDFSGIIPNPTYTKSTGRREVGPGVPGGLYPGRRRQ